MESFRPHYPRELASPKNFVGAVAVAVAVAVAAVVAAVEGAIVGDFPLARPENLPQTKMAAWPLQGSAVLAVLPLRDLLGPPLEFPPVSRCFYSQWVLPHRLLQTPSQTPPRQYFRPP